MRKNDIRSNMSDFAQRLREEIEYSGLLQKEVAEKAGIKKRALDMYLGTQCSMPPADVAVKLAKALNVSVEYLVTGEKTPTDPPRIQYKHIEEDLLILPQKVLLPLLDMIHNMADTERKNKKY